MNPLNWPIFPWRTLNLSGLFMFISIALAFTSIIIFLILANSKKIRYLSFKKLYTYVILLSCNIMLLFIFLWYVALPLVFITTLVTYRSVKKELIVIREQEMKGGWCCNNEYRKKQIEAFKSKSNDEQEEEMKYFLQHPLKLNPALIIVISVIIPIVLTLCLYACGIGYRWYTYPLA
jgi:hypothetical protein